MKQRYIKLNNFNEGMVVKSFNVSEETYEEFSKKCKRLGLSMSKQVDLFMKAQIEEEPRAREEYLQRLEQIRKANFVEVDGPLSQRY